MFIDTPRMTPGLYEALQGIRNVRVRAVPDGYELMASPDSPRLLLDTVTTPISRTRLRLLDLMSANNKYVESVRLTVVLFGHVGEIEPTTLDDRTYRLEIRNDRSVRVMCMGVDRVDSELAPYYHDVEALPQWARERLAVLMITSAEPPTQAVDGVGRRISERVFWIYAPQELTPAA